ncbi:glycosyltransferase family 4 protein [Shewanella sp. MF05960]|uniref:glycosyltransferase family 4 protein n=1 Tax=Shewanella sp. MF05960 TaxID=3434874 RepID=UPI003D7936B9
MKRIKVAFFIVSNGLGGAEKVLLEIIKRVDKTKYEPFLIVNNEIKDYYAAHVASENIFSLGNIYPLLNSSLAQRIIIRARPFFDISKLLLLSKVKSTYCFLKSNNIKIIHSHLMYDFLLSCSIREIDKSIRFIYTLHGFLNLKKENELTYVIKHKTFIKKLSNADVITCVSPQIETFMKESYPSLSSKLITITNGISDSLFNHNFRLDLEKSSLKVNMNKFSFLFIGGDKSVKGGILLVKAIKLFENNPALRDINFEVFFAGPYLNDSPLICQIKNDRYLSTKIKLLGYLDPIKMEEIYSKVDFLIMPSLSEGYPLAAVEAVNNGIPVICSNINAFKLMFDERFLIELSSKAILLMMSKLMTDNVYRSDFISSFIDFKVSVWSELIVSYEEIYCKSNQ